MLGRLTRRSQTKTYWYDISKRRVKRREQQEAERIAAEEIRARHMDLLVKGARAELQEERAARITRLGE